MDHKKLYQADLDSPCQEFSARGLRIVVALLVRPGIDFFMCVYCRGNPAVFSTQP